MFRDKREGFPPKLNLAQAGRICFGLAGFWMYFSPRSSIAESSVDLAARRRADQGERYTGDARQAGPDGEVPRGVGGYNRDNASRIPTSELEGDLGQIAIADVVRFSGVHAEHNQRTFRKEVGSRAGWHISRLQHLQESEE